MKCLESRVVPRIVAAPARYASQPGNPTLVYSAICAVLSGAGSEVRWAGFFPEDWRLMARIATAERVAPLLYAFSRSNACAAGFPADLVAQLARSYYQSCAYNALHFKRIREISNILSQRGIPFVLLKGSALGPALYGSPALRPMGDIDLLVQSDKLDQAVAALVSIDFCEQKAPIGRHLNHHVHLRGGEGNSEAVEIHWTLSGVPRQLEARLVGWLWQKVEPFDLQKSANGTSDRVLVLSPTAALLVSAAHQADQHRVRRLLWLYDIHLLLSQEAERINWAEAEVRAEEFGWFCVLRAALADAAFHFATPVPVHGRLAACADRPAHELESLELANPRPIAHLRRLSRLDWKDRLPMIRACTIPSRDDMIERYRPKPEFLWPLFYVVRWCSFGYALLKSVPLVLRRGFSGPRG
ncbi:MAG: hypothetical protein EHM61_14015 [Acidobacteria bacterium]|nr:MAG: hypothetical protein EHM61_14015 [Acidobacteriota bacterium]